MARTTLVIPRAKYDLGNVVKNFAKYRGISLSRVKPIEIVDYRDMYNIADASGAKNKDIFKGESNGLQVIYAGCMAPNRMDGGRYNDFVLSEGFLIQGSTRKLTGYREFGFNSLCLVDSSFENLLRRFATTLDSKIISRVPFDKPVEYKFEFTQNPKGLSGLETFLKVLAQ